VLLLGRDDEASRFARALELGADGCCSRSIAPTQLVEAIHLVAEGEVVMPPHLVNPVLQELRAGLRRKRDVVDTVHPLTTREQQILRLLSEGQRSSVIATRLGLSPHTVRTHLQHVMRKLGVHNQIQAAAEGRRLFGPEHAGQQQHSGL
jgi:DNA-binding NarL/FixJ family response regulator